MCLGYKSFKLRVRYLQRTTNRKSRVARGKLPILSLKFTASIRSFPVMRNTSQQASILTTRMTARSGRTLRMTPWSLRARSRLPLWCWLFSALRVKSCTHSSSLKVSRWPACVCGDFCRLNEQSGQGRALHLLPGPTYKTKRVQACLLEYVPHF